MDPRSIGWAIGFFLLAALAIPWFLWDSAAMAFGLPVWLWYHIAWLLLAALVFRHFTRRGWGLWIDERTDSHGGTR
ncbi:hypothetical protein HTSR_0395 [Halodesulfurarchaeum formicicum]|uniref:DUF3311 domain-containing protein n=1 Tax=Halodesulfurarchaeum formicicum TaxID=1873524 RepID=A0A1D8S2L1_9EURY|nr:DUF3311 domain-containing protein [Halodesulfurarchaeum formicicum]AOW79595.1 hypothetical protein HTSR_0395 [Halodesulfurarchaeum formicicum]APE94846.1 hypothetical protein HSR6_0380 [Halodesulfurarchaeum formicicum]